MILSVVLALVTSVAAARPTPPIVAEVQDVVSVNADPLRILDAARKWFADAASGTSEVEENSGAALLIASGQEKVGSAYSDDSCALWMRYRTTLAALPGRYYFHITVFDLEADPMCRRRSFHIDANGWLGTHEYKPVNISFVLRSPGDEVDTTDEAVKARGKALAERVAKGLRSKLASLEKPGPP
jgi:hypothetical protein